MKIPKARHLKSGNWFIYLRLGDEPISITAKTKTECEYMARKAKAEYKLNKPLRADKKDPDSITLSQAIDHWISSKQNSLSPSTVRGYRIIQNNRFQGYMDTKLSDIKDWQAVYDSEKDRLNPKTLKNSFALLRTVYQNETGHQIPKVDMLKITKSERQFLDSSQIQTFLDAVKGKPCEVGSLLALSSLRCSEILNLTWSDVDLDHKRILVQGAAVLDESNKLVRKKTNKTDSSTRYVPIFIPQLTSALTNAMQESMQVSMQENMEDNMEDMPVVNYKTESGLLRAINSVCRGAGLPEIGIHGLRHSFASICVSLSIPEETAMSIGGWSDFTTMRKIYTHISQRDRNEHIANLENFFGS